MNLNQEVGSNREDSTKPGPEPFLPVWRSTMLPVGATVQEAIENLNQTALQIVLVCGPNDILFGTLTDGDIRRGLLKGAGLKSTIEMIINREPIVVSPNLNREAILQLMHSRKLRHLPVVTESGELIGLHIWDEIQAPRARPNLMVIMAGGKGTRLRPHTENCPKPLLPIAGKPMMEHIIDRARAEGFSRFAVAIHYLGHMIEEYFGHGEKWGIQIEYLREKTPLGTAGALALLDPHPELPFIVSNGDVLTDIHYAALLDFHTRHEASGTMAVRMYESQHPFGVVQTNGIDVTGYEEKPITRANVNAGIYALAPECFSQLTQGVACDMPTLFSRLRDAGRRTIVYPMHEPWLDVGRADDYASAQIQMRMDA
jgi:dTDP-glucose pyrophosphorylase